ncbi:DUF4192 domain-containing protein [Dactylosporangium aurantiacum]|uniref:DUF4192 domain-containing protein n=1 Tax=Dactylosporangium aurantiacum TaxID=35754 RepID=A0A9Q9IRW8_9ACTN|nr:DUF4192 domain-containing protein [Dactylosporangium aurantiacum]MDG6104020.1 DUF4192 domain-containing protein [Dactylosporangium aurantiacum]UWZ58805.1 DUF4192 domain-containing protein [Dactylosporangium aurantiacum]
MTSTPMPLRLSSPTDLLSAIPYLVGFHPNDSVVCVAVRDTQRPCFVNLPVAGVDADGGAAVRRTVAYVAATAHTAIIVGYGSPQRVDAVAAQLHTALTSLGVAVPGVWRSTEGRYYCLIPGCAACPVDGEAYNPDTSPVAAQLVANGVVALPDRAALAAQLDPVRGRRRAAMDTACRRAVHRLQAMIGDNTGRIDNLPDHGPRSRLDATPGPAVQPAPTHVVDAGARALRDALHDAEQGRVLSDDEVGWLAVLLHLPAVESLAWRCTTDEPWQRQLWTDVTRRATPPLVGAPACLLASCAYLAGNGALANVAMDLALQTGFTSSMARQLEVALDAGMPPAQWRSTLRAATAGSAPRQQHC